MTSKVLCFALLIGALVQAAPPTNTKDAIPVSPELIVNTADASGAGEDSSEDFSIDIVVRSTESVVESTTHLTDATEVTPTSTEELTESTTSSEDLHVGLRDEWSSYIYLVRALKKKGAKAAITHSDTETILATNEATLTSPTNVTESKSSSEDHHEGLREAWPAYVYLVRALKKKMVKAEITSATSEANTEANTEASTEAITKATTEATTEITPTTTQVTPTSPAEVTETNNSSENLVHPIAKRETQAETTAAITETTAGITATTSAITETTAAITETTPVITATTPEVTETTAAVTETTPAVTETTPAVTETTPAVTETTPEVIETTPIITETTSAIMEPIFTTTKTIPAVTEVASASTKEVTKLDISSEALPENQRNEWSVIMDLTHAVSKKAMKPDHFFDTSL